MTRPTHAYGLSADKEIPLISGGEELTHLGDTLVPLLDLTQTNTEKIAKSTVHYSQAPLTYDMKLYDMKLFDLLVFGTKS